MVFVLHVHSLLIAVTLFVVAICSCASFIESVGFGFLLFQGYDNSATPLKSICHLSLFVLCLKYICMYIINSFTNQASWFVKWLQEKSLTFSLLAGIQSLCRNHIRCERKILMWKTGVKAWSAWGKKNIPGYVCKSVVCFFLKRLRLDGMAKLFILSFLKLAHGNILTLESPMIHWNHWVKIPILTLRQLRKYLLYLLGHFYTASASHLLNLKLHTFFLLLSGWVADCVKYEQ